MDAWDLSDGMQREEHDYAENDPAEDFGYRPGVGIRPEAHSGDRDVSGSCAPVEPVILPSGGVDGGDGGADNSDRLAASGTAMLGAAALGGLVLMRRRRINGSLT